MAKTRFTRRRSGVAGLCFMLLIAAFLRPAAVGAVEMASLYTVEIVLDQSAGNDQERAFEEALKAVLVRVTGDETAGQNEDLLGLFPNPGQYVLQFQRGDAGTLFVSLDGEAIEALLRRANQPVWGNDRPLTLIWVAIDRGLGDREIVAAEEEGGLRTPLDRNRELRERIEAVAERRGIPIAFPLVDGEDLESISFSDIWGGFDRALIDASRRYGASSILVGRIRSEDVFGNRWSHYLGEQQQTWTGTPETVVNLLADSLAERFAIAGNAPSETVTLTISGVETIAAFGAVQRLLNETSVVDSFTVDTVAGSQIRYAVSVQGGAERLASALEFSGVLQRRDWLDVEQLFPGDAGNASLDYDFSPIRMDTTFDLPAEPDVSSTESYTPR